jgi:ABC-type bacteriocin/lantibiotic exporter with double-glycine peptidase domain
MNSCTGPTSLKIVSDSFEPCWKQSPVERCEEPSLKLLKPRMLEARAVSKTYRKGRHEVPVLIDCDFHALPGKLTAILGQSGSGKSTLLHLLGTLDAPDT